MYRLTASCGATFPDQADDPSIGHRRPRKDGRLVFVTYDTDTKITQPKMPDGSTARCRFECPCKRLAGRKETRCFPVDEAEVWKRWRYVVTCAFSVSRPETLQ